MDEYEAIAFLTDVSHESRYESIKTLHNILKASKGKSKFSDLYEISRGLAVVLFDREIDVRIHGLNFVADFINGLEDNVCNCIHAIIPALLTCLEDSRSGVQLSAIKCIKACLKKTENFQNTLDLIISEGLNSRNKKLSKSLISKLHLIVTDFKSNPNISRLIHALFDQLSNKFLQTNVFEALKKLKNILGEKSFNNYSKNVDENSIKIYNHLNSDVRDSSSIDSLMKSEELFSSKDIPDYDDDNSDGDNQAHLMNSNSQFVFGFLPRNLYNRLLINESMLEKEEALEDLKFVCNNPDNNHVLLKNFSDFLELLMKLFDSSNVRSNVICLDIIKNLLDRFGSKLKPHTNILISSLFPFICTDSVYLKDNVFKLMINMFFTLGIIDSSQVLCNFLKHSRSRLRQEALNFIIRLLLMSDLKMVEIEFFVRPVMETLLDSKKLIRQASMECCALLGHFLNGTRNPMISSSLNQLEQMSRGCGVTKAVTERFNLNKLPKCNKDGTIKYTAINNNVAPLVLEWVLLAGNGLNAGRSVSTDEFNMANDWKGSKTDEQSGLEALSSPLQSQKVFKQDVGKSLSRLNWNDTSQDMNKMTEDMNALRTSTTSNLSRYEPFLCPITRSAALARVGSIKRKFHSAGQLERTGTIVEDHHEGGNCGVNARGGGCLVDDEGSDYSCMKDSSKIGFYSTAPPALTNYSGRPPSQTKISAGKNRVTKMFDMLEKKERFDGRRLVNREKGVDDGGDTGGPSRRCPVKANYEHRVFLNKDSSYIDSEGDRVHKTNMYNAFSNDVEDSRHNDKIPWDEVAICGVKCLDETGGDFNDDDDVPTMHVSDRVPSPPIKSAFPGRSEYPFEEEWKNERKCNVNNNATSLTTFHNNASSTHNSLAKNNNNILTPPNNYNNSRRISVVHIEMPDSLSLFTKIDPNQKETTPNNNRTSTKPPKYRMSMRKKKDSILEPEDRIEEKTIQKPSISTIQDIITILNSDDWKTEVSSLEAISTMCSTNTELIASNLHSLIHPILKEVTNLRSNVSKAAIKCLSEMFKSLQTAMESVLDRTVMELLNRSGHTNNFMKEEAIKCLNVIIENVSPLKSINAITNHGNNNRSVLIRNASSQLLINICLMLGPDSILVEGPKELTSKVLSTASHYLTDGSPDVRTNGRKIFSILKGHSEFDRCLRLHLPHDVIVRNVEPVLKGLENRNEMEHNTTMSAQMRVPKNTMKHSRYHSAGNLCNIVNNADGISQQQQPTKTLSPTTKTTTKPQSSKAKKQYFAKLDDTTLDAVNKILDDLDSNDFRQRLNGLSQLRTLVVQEGKANAMVSHINTIFDKLVPCLKDSNYKVAIQALQVFKDLLPHLAPHLTNIISMTVATVATNMASNNRDVRDSANAVLDGCIQFIDPAILMPSFVTATSNANNRYKVYMIGKVSELVRHLPAQRSRTISLLVFPLLWQLLSMMSTGGSNKTNPNSLRQSTARLVGDLKNILGSGLMEHAHMNSKVNLSMRQLLQELMQMRIDDDAGVDQTEGY